MNDKGTIFPERLPQFKINEISTKLVYSIIHYVGLDPEPYKTEFLVKILLARIKFHQCNTTNQYLDILCSNAVEQKTLISNFICDTPSLFQLAELKTAIEKNISRNLSSNNSLYRIWIPFYGTGELAVSLACFLEKKLEKTNKTFKVYATETNIEALKNPLKNQSFHFTPRKILEKNLIFKAQGWKLKRSISNKISFTRFNFLNNLLFKNIDLILVTNCYDSLKTEYQDKLMEICNGVLSPNGYLYFCMPEPDTNLYFEKHSDSPVFFAKKHLSQDSILERLFYSYLPIKKNINFKKSQKENEKVEFDLVLDRNLGINHIAKDTQTQLNCSKIDHLRELLTTGSFKKITEQRKYNSTATNFSVIKVKNLPFSFNLKLIPICDNELIIAQFKSNSDFLATKNSNIESKSTFLNDNSYQITNELKNDKEGLKEENHELEKVLFNLETAFILLDSELKIQKINKGAANLFSIDHKDLNKYIYDCIPTFENPRIIENLIGVLKEGRTVEKEINSINGEVLKIKMSPYGLPNLSGKKINLLCYKINLTEPKSSQKAQWKNNFNKFLETTSNIFYTRSLHKKMRINYISKSVYNLTGITATEFLKNGNLWMDMVHHDDFKQIEQGFENLKKFKFCEVEYRMLTKHKEWIWIKDEFQIFDQDGEKLIVGTWTDITAKRITDIAYLKDEESNSIPSKGFSEKVNKNEIDEINFKNVINSTDDLIVAIDTNWKYVGFNKPYSKFYKKVMNKDIFPNGLIKEEDGELSSKTNIDNWKKALAGVQFELVQEYRIKGKNMFFGIKYTPIKNQIGKIIGAIQFLREITNQINNKRTLHQTLAKLQESNKELEHFTYIISHDLRSPSSNLKGLIDIFKLKGHINEKNRALFERISSAADQIHETLNELLEIVSINKPTDKKNNYIKFDLVANKVEKILYPQILKSNATIRHNFSEVEGINYKFAHLKSIFLNILSNAIKYKHPNRNPIIDISSFKKDNFICISIKDNGIGFDESQKHEIFEMFQRLNKNIEGKGLGLYITKSLIESMGGKIDVNSVKGEGSTFNICLVNH